MQQQSLVEMEEGDQLNQLNFPQGIYVDNQQLSIYIADYLNCRIVKWKIGENYGQIIAETKWSQGNSIDQLYWSSRCDCRSKQQIFDYL